MRYVLNGAVRSDCVAANTDSTRPLASVPVVKVRIVMAVKTGPLGFSGAAVLLLVEFSDNAVVLFILMI